MTLPAWDEDEIVWMDVHQILVDVNCVVVLIVWQVVEMLSDQPCQTESLLLALVVDQTDGETTRSVDVWSDHSSPVDVDDHAVWRDSVTTEALDGSELITLDPCVELDPLIVSSGRIVAVLFLVVVHLLLSERHLQEVLDLKDLSLVGI